MTEDEAQSAFVVSVLVGGATGLILQHFTPDNYLVTGVSLLAFILSVIVIGMVND